MSEKISSAQAIQLFLLACIAISTGAIALYLYRIPTGMEASKNIKAMVNAPAVYVRGRVDGSVSVDGTVDVSGSSVTIEDKQPQQLRKLIY